MNQDTPTSSGLIIGIILGILILGGIFLYMRSNTAPADNGRSLDVNVTLPAGSGQEGGAAE